MVTVSFCHLIITNDDGLGVYTTVSHGNHSETLSQPDLPPKTCAVDNVGYEYVEEKFAVPACFVSAEDDRQFHCDGSSSHSINCICRFVFIQSRQSIETDETLKSPAKWTTRTLTVKNKVLN